MYVSTLDPDGDLTFNILKGEGEFIIRVPIGYDDGSGHVYSMFMALSPLVGYADVPGYELVFNVIEAATDGSEIDAHWDGNATKGFLGSAEERGLVRAVMHMAVSTLIDEADPKLVSMTTHTANLPGKALEKFHEICAVFRSKGFKAGKADVWHGRHIWMMTR